MSTATGYVHEARAAWMDVENARRAYDAKAERATLVLLREFLDEHPRIVSLTITTSFEYDDEGSYMLCRSGSVDPDEGGDDDDWMDFMQQELDPDSSIELFGMDVRGEEEGTLTRAEIETKAREARV